MYLKERGQISIEYLILVSFITFLIIGILSASIYSFSIIRDKNKFNQLESFSQKIVNSAESIYYAGEPSKATINAYLPPGVNEILIQDNSLRCS